MAGVEHIRKKTSLRSRVPNIFPGDETTTTVAGFGVATTASCWIAVAAYEGAMGVTN